MPIRIPPSNECKTDQMQYFSSFSVNASLPFAVHFFSDDRYDQTSNNTERGFKFQYKIV